MVRFYVKALGYSLPATNFYLANGPELLLEHPLTEESVVFDAGGFEGKCSEKILQRYSPCVHIFEPHPDACALLKHKFDGNPRVRYHGFGLGGHSREDRLYGRGPGCSVFQQDAGPGPSYPVLLRDVREELDECRLGKVDLIKINIEGCEYELLDRMIQTGIVRRFKSIMVQYHKFVPYAVLTRKRLSRALARTHRRTWCFPFVWECWSARV
ncbi:MAG: FkbM family methyltransferase [Candidatus Omnitrophica bacterium]|nr:FkbM family methyltransferase [Candidatus Omnitrophota bacterium]